MPITTVTTDPEALTMTVVADFTAPLRRLWDAYLDPRLLEKFWGPPEWPATFVRHDAHTGGWSHYFMTGPSGETTHGYWQWISVDDLRGFEVRDGFANDDGTPNTDTPSMRMTFVFEETGRGSRCVTTTHFDSVEDLDTLLGMGMEEGMASAMGQMDAVLADLAAFAAGDGTATQILSDTTVRISRVIRGDVETVWRAHHDAALIRRWMLGPDGWTMPVCEPASSVGEAYRWEWEDSNGENRFGFTGTVLESHPPYREVTSESMIGTDGPAVRSELTLTAVEAGTLLATVLTYPDAATRDTVLATGMADGMEASYARLETVVTAATPQV